MNFEALFAACADLKVAVIGDVMLDTYWWGHVERISPEAPVPVVALDHKEYRMGGAANVALNTASLGAPTFVFSVIGNDDDGQLLTGLLQKAPINSNFIVKSKARITTNKIRIISRNQHMMRLDAEQTTAIKASESQQLIDNFKAFVTEHQPQVAIFEDYNKGVLTPEVIETCIAICKQHNIITTVDPKRHNFFNFIGVDLFKPNLKEVREGLNTLLADATLTDLQSIHQQLKDKLQHAISLITLSEKGVFYQQDEDAAIIPTHVRNIADVSGAGDTVIAVASLMYALTKDIRLAAELANIAGGLVCEEVGTVAINKQKLFDEAIRLLR